MYTVTTGLHMVIYAVSCIDVHVCLCFPEVMECMYTSTTETYDVETYMV